MDKEKIIRDSRAMPLLSLSKKFELPQETIQEILGQERDQEAVEVNKFELELDYLLAEAKHGKKLDEDRARVIKAKLMRLR